jgi:hypothetical protein
MGLTALAVARILKITITGTYQNRFPELSECLLEDELTEDLFWKYLQWFYNLLDRIYVYKTSDRELLTQKGISAEKIVVLHSGSMPRETISAGRVSRVDTEGAFHRSGKVRGAA